MVQWVLQIIMEALPDLARATLDAINAFGDLERPCTQAALLANVHLHQLIPLYDVLYTRSSKELWYYDAFGNFVLALFYKRGVRQGCVPGNAILIITVRPVYDALRNALGFEGFLFSYADDVYMGGTPVQVADALTAAHGIYASVGLSIGWGPKKTELVLPTDCDPEELPISRNPRGEPLSDIVHGFKACMWVPRHPANDVELILEALQQVANRHDNLLELFGDVSEEDPFAALRLIQVCAVNRFGHILSAVPPEAASLFAEQRDLAITNALAVVQGFPIDPATTTHDLPVVAGGRAFRHSSALRSPAT